MNNAVEVDFKDSSKGNIRVIDGGNNKKLKKDGTVKKTKCNAVVGRSTWKDPIRSKEDIQNVIEFLQNKIDNEYRADYRKAYARNLLYFVIGVFSGFRVSDMIGAREGTMYKNIDEYGNMYYTYPQWTGLKWSDIFCKDGKTFRKNICIKEIKTGNMKPLYLTEKSKQYIVNYVDKYNPDTCSDNYIFVNRKNERLSCESVNVFIKELATKCNLVGDYSSHSIRKTFVYQMYMALYNNHDPLALEKTMRFTGHKNVSDLLRYLGLKNQQEEADMRVMEEYLSDIF